MFLSHFNLEDFIRPPGSKFLITRKETNILNYICPDMLPKIEITKYIVSSIRKRDNSFFPTQAHVNWSMECIGFAFSLPIEYHTTISSAIDIYRNWLGLGSECRPLCIEQDKEAYQREIISHLSLLFVERAGDVHKHAELCRDALLLIKDLCRKTELEKCTWHHLLKLFIMITGGLLKNNTLLVKEIAPLLFKTLFEIWFRSNTREKELWEELNKSMGQWVNHIWVVFHWRAIETGLTQAVIGMIYGQDETEVKIKFKKLQKPFEIEAENVFIACDKEKIIYFWYQFLQIVSRNTISKIPMDSEICRELVKSFAIITDMFIDFAKSRNSKLKIDYASQGESGCKEVDDLLLQCKDIHQRYIDGELRVPAPRINSILSVLGNWLFAYANCDYLYCEAGRAKAIGTLCRVFSSNLGPVSQDYAGRFYKTIFYIMKGGVNQIVIKNILKYSTSLLCSDTPGIRILLDRDYIFKAIALQFNDRKYDPKLRRYCYDITSCFVACAQYLRLIEVNKNLYDILLDAVQNENDPVNFNKLIWIICSFVSTMQSHNELIHNIVTALTNRLKNITDDKMYTNLLCMLSTVPFLIFDKSPSTMPMVHRTLMKLCTYIKKKYQLSNKSLACSLIFCIRKWLVCFPAVLNESKLRLTILEVLACTQLVEKLNAISLYMEQFIACNIGKNREVIRLTVMSELVMPVGLMRCPRQEFRNYMIFDKTLLSLQGYEDEVVGIFRTSIGRSIWKAQAKYSTIAAPKELKWQMDIMDSEKSVEILESKELVEDFKEFEVDMLERIKELQARQECRKNVRNKPSMKKINIKEKNKYLDSSKLLLAHLGLFDYDQLQEITEIQSDIAIPKIASLDTFSEKEIFFLPVIYINQSMSLDFKVDCQCYSNEFEYFLQQLGVLLDSKHMDLGFLSHLSMALENFKKLLYISDGLHEILSIVPCLTDGTITLQEIVGASPVVAIWNQRIDDKHCIIQPSILGYPELEHKVCILLTPLSNKMVKVNFFPSTEQPGPLSENMVVPLDILGKLILYTLINIYGDSLEAITSRKTRQDILEQLDFLGKEQASSSERFNSFLAYTFNVTPITKPS